MDEKFEMMARKAVQSWTAKDGGLTYAASDIIAFGAWLDSLIEQAARAKTPAEFQDVITSWEAAHEDTSFDAEFSLLSAAGEEIDSHARRVCESISDPVERAGTYWLLRRSYRDHEGDVVIPLPLFRGWGKTDILAWAASRAVQEGMADDPEAVVEGLLKIIAHARAKARDSKRADARRKWKGRLEGLQIMEYFLPGLSKLAVELISEADFSGCDQNSTSWGNWV